MPLIWQKSISRTMDVCRIILDAIRKYVLDKQSSTSAKQIIIRLHSACICFRSLRRLQKRAENGAELKPIVFALFSQNEKSATCRDAKLLIFYVDQVGLEPTTSRL